MVKFVTSFSADGFERYARKMLLSVIENWKDDLKLIAYYHDFTDDLVKELPVAMSWGESNVYIPATINWLKFIGRRSELLPEVIVAHPLTLLHAQAFKLLLCLHLAAVRG